MSGGKGLDPVQTNINGFTENLAHIMKKIVTEQGTEINPYFYNEFYVSSHRHNTLPSHFPTDSLQSPDSLQLR